jgi:hypothetical protein
MGVGRGFISFYVAARMRPQIITSPSTTVANLATRLTWLMVCTLGDDQVDRDFNCRQVAVGRDFQFAGADWAAEAVFTASQ